MKDEPTSLRDDEIETELGGGATPITMDADGADGDATDSSDGDGSDGDANDSSDGDATDSGDADGQDA